jgi:hypothetical protein
VNAEKYNFGVRSRHDAEGSIEQRLSERDPPTQNRGGFSEGVLSLGFQANRLSSNPIRPTNLLSEQRRSPSDHMRPETTNLSYSSAVRSAMVSIENSRSTLARPASPIARR